MTHTSSPSWFILRSKATADIRYNVLVPAVLLTALATLIVGLRWCSRLCSNPTRVGLEDYFITAAMICSIGFTATVGGEVSIDVADHTENGTYPALLPTMLRLVLAQSVLYHLASNLVKASLIIQYMRLFSSVLHIARSCYVLLLLVVGATGWGVFGNIFLCKPVQSYWDTTVKGTCMDKEKHFWSASVIGIAIDFAIWVLPLPVIGLLRLPRRQKLGLLFVFGLGVLVCIITLLRLILVQHTVLRGEVTKCGTYAIIFSSIEVNVTIVCASLIVMKPLLARFLPYAISEQPVSAVEDGRACRALTGVHLMRASMAEAAKNRERGERNDTLVETSRYSRWNGIARESKKKTNTAEGLGEACDIRM